MSRRKHTGLRISPNTNTYSIRHPPAYLLWKLRIFSMPPELQPDSAFPWGRRGRSPTWTSPYSQSCRAKCRIACESNARESAGIANPTLRTENFQRPLRQCFMPVIDVPACVPRTRLDHSDGRRFACPGGLRPGRLRRWGFCRFAVAIGRCEADGCYCPAAIGSTGRTDSSSSSRRAAAWLTRRRRQIRASWIASSTRPARARRQANS